MSYNMPEYSLQISVPCGFHYEVRNTGRYLTSLGLHLGIHAQQIGIKEVNFFDAVKHRIHIGRNICVKTAQEQEATHLLFVDPDMEPDAWLDEPGSVPFFDTAWSLLTREKPGSIAAAPYCGLCPDGSRAVHVFGMDADSGGPARLTLNEAAKLENWHRVVAIGTGLMLIDMSIFEKLEPPYFEDIENYEKTRTAWSQDTNFCMKCKDADIPVYANFSAWAEHWQLSPAGRPGKPIADGPNHEPDGEAVPHVACGPCG